MQLNRKKETLHSVQKNIEKNLDFCYNYCSNSQVKCIRDEESEAVPAKIYENPSLFCYAVEQ